MQNSKLLTSAPLVLAPSAKIAEFVSKRAEFIEVHRLTVGIAIRLGDLSDLDPQERFVKLLASLLKIDGEQITEDRVLNMDIRDAEKAIEILNKY